MNERRHAFSVHRSSFILPRLFSSCHQQSNLFYSGLLRINFTDDAPFVNYQQAVGQSRDLFKLCGDEKYGTARVTKANEFAVNKFDCAYVDAARRLRDEKQFWVKLKLAAKD